MPHVFAEIKLGAYFRLGFAMAQDRLWQMEFFRRRSHGQLAEILGRDYLGSDWIHRTLDITEIAESDAERLDDETRSILEAWVVGINRQIESSETRPIELDILGVRPERWKEGDVIVALRGFWWSLNGRIETIVAGEIASLLPEGPLRDAYLTPPLSDERIAPPGSPYPEAGAIASGSAPLFPRLGSSSVGADDGRTGSNNWGGGRVAHPIR